MIIASGFLDSTVNRNMHDTITTVLDRDTEKTLIVPGISRRAKKDMSSCG